MCRQVYNGTPVQPFKFWELVASSWMGTRITVSRFHLPLPWCQLFALRLRSSLVGLIVELYIFFWANKGLKQTSLIAEASLQFTRGCWPGTECLQNAVWELQASVSYHFAHSRQALFVYLKRNDLRLRNMYRWNSFCETAQYIVAWTFTYSTMQFALIRIEGKEA